jgi:hypothetical protein
VINGYDEFQTCVANGLYFKMYLWGKTWNKVAWKQQLSFCVRYFENSWDNQIRCLFDSDHINNIIEFGPDLVSELINTWTGKLAIPWSPFDRQTLNIISVLTVLPSSGLINSFFESSILIEDCLVSESWKRQTLGWWPTITERKRFNSG